MGSIAIEAKGLQKSYRIYHGSRDKWRELLPTHREDATFWALRDVDLRIEAGEAVGIVGVNGSGKTTLSNLIAGVAKPTGGELTVNGTTAMIAVSAGLNQRLTGLENIEMKGLLIGLSRQRIRELMPQIIEFADIGEYIDQPVRNYSSGMRSRLAFAISINIDPDILVIDEGLSVGDTTFVDRCLERMKRFQEDGKTMLLTSHSTAQLRDFCQRLIWLEGGRVRMDGPLEPVMAEYNMFIKWYRTLSGREQRDYTQQIRAGQRGRLRPPVHVEQEREPTVSAKTEQEQTPALSRKELTALVEGVDLEMMPSGVRVILRLYPEAERLGAQYAFYLMREGEILSKVSYQDDPECVFSDLEPGEYRVKCFICVGRSRCSCGLRDVVILPQEMREGEYD